MIESIRMVFISDLHVHTNFSDGKESPEQVLELAKSVGIKQISITDHNDLRAIDKAEKKASDKGLDFVKGVELDVKMEFEGEVFHNHLLAYNFDKTTLEPFVDKIKELNKNYFEKLVQNLKYFLKQRDFSFNETLIEFKEDIDIDSIGSKEIVVDEYKRKYSKDLGEKEVDSILKEKFLGPEIIYRYIKNNLLKNPSNITKKYPTTWKKVLFDNLKGIFEVSGNFYKSHLDAILKIKKSGGKSILAHPFLDYLFWDDNKKEKFIRLIAYLARKGLDGLEIYYYSNDRYSKKEQDELNSITRNICENLNLRLTYGSDHHGENLSFLGKFGSRDFISF